MTEILVSIYNASKVFLLSLIRTGNEERIHHIQRSWNDNMSTSSTTLPAPPTTTTTTTTTSRITNSEILWKLIQGQQAMEWAKTKVGWNTGSSTASSHIEDDGMCVFHWV
jgi:hypothetical protein